MSLIKLICVDFFTLVINYNNLILKTLFFFFFLLLVGLLFTFIFVSFKSKSKGRQ
jgi:hypothetical protein